MFHRQPTQQWQCVCHSLIFECMIIISGSTAASEAAPDQTTKPKLANIYCFRSTLAAPSSTNRIKCKQFRQNYLFALKRFATQAELWLWRSQHISISISPSFHSSHLFANARRKLKAKFACRRPAETGDGPNANRKTEWLQVSKSEDYRRTI